MFGKKVVGVDLSDFSLKICQLKKRFNKIFFVKKRRVDFKEKMIEKGVVKKEKEKKLVEILKKEIKLFSPKQKEIVATLPEEEAFLKVFSLPKVSFKELKENISWEIEKIFPVKIDEMFFDWKIIEENEKEIKIAAVLISKKIVESYLSLFKKADLEVKIFEMESVASLWSVLKNFLSPEPVLILNLGKTGTNFLFFFKNAPYFSSRLDISSDEIDKKISQKMNVPLKEAEALKKEYGLSFIQHHHHLSISRIKMEKEIFEIISPSIKKLANEIKSRLQYLRGLSEKEKEIKKIILCGGGANLKGIDEYLEDLLKIKVEIANPLVNLSPPYPISTEEALSFTVCIGVCLRSLVKNDWI